MVLDAPAFVSYSRKDAPLVRAVIKEQRYLYFYLDTDDTPPGSDWEEEHRERIAKSNPFLLFWSKNSAQSENVEREWQLALQFEKRIVPVLVDDTPLKTPLDRLHAVDVREYVRAHCRPMHVNTSLLGSCLLFSGAAFFLLQVYSLVKRGLDGGSIFLAVVALLGGLIGYAIVRRWMRWLRFKSFVDRFVIREVRRMYAEEQNKRMESNG